MDREQLRLGVEVELQAKKRGGQPRAKAEKGLEDVADTGSEQCSPNPHPKC